MVSDSAFFADYGICLYQRRTVEYGLPVCGCAFSGRNDERPVFRNGKRRERPPAYAENDCVFGDGVSAGQLCGLGTADHRGKHG